MQRKKVFLLCRFAAECGFPVSLSLQLIFIRNGVYKLKKKSKGKNLKSTLCYCSYCGCKLDQIRMAELDRKVGKCFEMLGEALS